MKLIYKYFDIFLILAIILFAGVVSNVNEKMESNGEYQTVTIQAGDTVSEIAVSFGAEDMGDIEEFVSWVEQYNDIDAEEIKPGQEIIIPVEVPEGVVVAQN